MLIKNNTSLNYQTIGNIIDKITTENIEDTHYFGQVQWCQMNVYGKTINVQIRYLKRYVEWYFKEIKENKP